MIIERKGHRQKVPDFLIVGAAKAGTTSVHHYLQRHPDVFMPTPKEPFFFAYLNVPPDYNGPCQDFVISTPDDYLQLFAQAEESMTLGECSNIYLYHYRKTIQNIQSFYGDRWRDLKIVMILRNPADRTFSMYEMLRRRGVEELPFDEAVSEKTIQKRLGDNYSLAYDYLGWGMYYEQVKAYMEAFPCCRIYLTEDLKVSTADVMNDLFQYIGVAPCDSIDFSINYNLSGNYRNRLMGRLTNQLGLMDGLKKPFIKLMGEQRFKSMTYRIKKKNLQRETLSEMQRKRLQEYFRPDVLRLSELLDRNLEGWLQ